jgi:S-adenosylmethionine:tRNA ribosyltransferase-isomerase
VAAQLQDMPGTLDFVLPPELEARRPPEARGVARDQVRLLVSHKRCGWIEHTRFDRISDYLDAGDALIVNDSKTLPAGLPAIRSDGTSLALHLSTPVPGGRRSGYEALTTQAPLRWVAEPRPAAARGDVLNGSYRGRSNTAIWWPRTSRGSFRLLLPAGGRATLETAFRGSRRLWEVILDLPEPLAPYLARHGRPITYPYVDGTWPIEAYQTAYATVPGSAEMPSAGRAFTLDTLATLLARGVSIGRVTLHTGVASMERDERPYPEWFRVSEQTARLVNETRARDGRVIAVGTTVVRALESAVGNDGQAHGTSGWTEVVISAERGIRLVDGLLTGFHEPRASHLDMLAAIAGRSHVASAYQAALAGQYLWHEFGDLHLIL